MKIAVTYDNGNVFEHFGHSESFAIYEAENGTVIEKRIVGTGRISVTRSPTAAATARWRRF